MLRRARWSFALLAVISVLALAAPLTAAPRAAYVPEFAAARCPFRVPQSIRITCGYLVVPEDRSLPSGRHIRLAVAIARTARSPRRRDPVVYLAGGPGSAAVASTTTLAYGWATFLAHRDLIVVDQRGTGFSQPSLACPEHDVALAALQIDPRPPGERAGVEYAALQRCRDRLARAGVQLAAYTTAANAQDLRDLRVALGYQQWNVFGISYGTRLALTALRYDAQGMRSLVLDSVYPPQANLFTAMPAALNRALHTLFASCATAPACQHAYPHLQDNFQRLITHLDQQPITVQVRDPRNGKSVPMHIDGSRLIEVVFRSLYRSELIPHLPRMITAVTRGDYGLLAEMDRKRLQRAQGHSAAMYYAVECSEDLAVTNLATRSAAARRYPQLAGYYAGLQEFTSNSSGLCAAWRSAAPGPDLTAPVHSDVPVLLLAGEYDPITPPDWAVAAAATLPKSEVYRFAGTGHAVITRGACPRQIIRAFLDTFSARAAAACRRYIGAPTFITE